MRVHQYFLEVAVNNAEKETEKLKKELTKVAKVTGRLKAFP